VDNLVVLSNIAGEIQVSPKIVKTWLEVLERMCRGKDKNAHGLAE